MIYNDLLTYIQILINTYYLTHNYFRKRLWAPAGGLFMLCITYKLQLNLYVRARNYNNKFDFSSGSVAV